MSQPARDLCSESEIVYCENYVISLSKTTAAKAMGSESDTPGIIGWQVYQRPNVQAYIKELLAINTSTAEDTLKRIDNTSKANMSDYLVPVKKWTTPTVKKGLAQLIEESRNYIKLEEEFCEIKGYTEDAFDKFQEQLEQIRDRIVRYEIELRINPEAFRLVDGDAVEVETMELDLNLIAADKERGIIKSFKHTPNGIAVELCDPDTSKDRMAKVHGLYEKDNEQQGKNFTVSLNIVKSSAPDLASNEKDIS